jgi:hypothetical protein
MNVHDLQDMHHGQSVRVGITANANRNVFADYFLSDAGYLSWQLSKI